MYQLFSLALIVAVAYVLLQVCHIGAQWHALAATLTP